MKVTCDQSNGRQRSVVFPLRYESRRYSVNSIIDNWQLPHQGTRTVCTHMAVPRHCPLSGSFMQDWHDVGSDRSGGRSTQTDAFVDPHPAR